MSSRGKKTTNKAKPSKSFVSKAKALKNKFMKAVPLKTKPVKKKTLKTKPLKTTHSKADLPNPFASEFLHLKNEVKKAYSKLESDLKMHADPKKLQEDNNRLFLLLGECHYLARECWKRTHPKGK